MVIEIGYLLRRIKGESYVFWDFTIKCIKIQSFTLALHSGEKRGIRITQVPCCFCDRFNHISIDKTKKLSTKEDYVSLKSIYGIVFRWFDNREIDS